MNRSSAAPGKNAYFVVFNTDELQDLEWAINYDTLNGSGRVRARGPYRYCFYTSALNDSEALFAARAKLAASGLAHAQVTLVEVTEDKKFRTVLKGA